MSSSVKSDEKRNSSVKEVADSNTRFSIIIILLLTSIIVGLPSWYFTTSVERATLPIEEMTSLSEEYFNNVNYEIPVQIIDIPNPLDGLISESQELIDKKLKDSKVGIKLYKNDQFESYYKLKLILNEDYDSLTVSPYSDRLIKLFITPGIISNGLVSDLISRVLIDNVFKFEIESIDNNRKNIVKFPFSDNYKVSINFLHSNNEIFKLNNDTLEKVMRNFQNFVKSLELFAKFTIEFQELWYENRLITKDEYKVDDITYIKDPSMLIDYSDWGLDQDVELDPIINLNLYLPDDEKLIIENSSKNSFIIPQWGGVVILNEEEAETLDYDKLNEIFDIFAFQLLKLIGVDTDSNKSLFYRIDELTRIQTIDNINNSLINFKSLIKLVNQLDTIPIPLQSVNEINQSLIHIKDCLKELEQLDWIKAHQTSTLALKLSNNAFFHKDMVQQAYFPEKHKMAVYSPLLGPFVTIVVLALIRGIKEVRGG